MRGLKGLCSLRKNNEKQPQVPIRLRSGQAFDSAEKRFAQDDRLLREGRVERGRGRPRYSRSGDRRYSAVDRRYEFGNCDSLVVFALPFGVGALEIFYSVFLEIP